MEKKKVAIIGLIILVTIILGVKLYNNWYFGRDMMLEARLNPSITLLNDETVLIAGGNLSGEFGVSGTAEVYDPRTHKSHYVGNLNIRRNYHKAILLDDGRVLIVGGMSPGKKGYLKQAEIYDPKTQKFQLVTDESKTDKNNGKPYLVKLNDGKIFLLGRKQVENFDPKTEKFTLIGETIGNQDNSSAALLPDGNLIILGKSSQKISEKLYNSREGLFTNPRYVAEIFYLPNRRHFNVEKFGNKFKKELWQENSSEIYNVKFNKFSVGPQMPVEKRRAIRPVALEDGRIVIAGGEDTGARPVSEVEIYDPKTNKFQSAGNMTRKRIGFSPIVLEKGLVYIVGGDYTNRNDSFTDKNKPTCELFNPKTNEFKMTNVCMKNLKYGYKPILLKDGRLLIIAGGKPGISKNLERKIEIINTKEIK